MKLSSCCRLKELQQGTPGTKILAASMGQFIFNCRNIFHPKLQVHTDKFSEQADKTAKSSQGQEGFYGFFPLFSVV